MNAPDPLGFAADVDHDDDVDDDDDVEHVWESREVRWSALAGFLLVVGFVAGRFDAPDIAVTGLYVASTGGKVSCLDPATGVRYWKYDELTDPKYNTLLLPSPTVTVSRTPEGDRRLLYFAATVNDGTNAVVFCLEDQWVSEWSEE